MKGQQTDEPLPAEHPDNLFEPIPRDEGAHGPFDAKAHDRSLQLWATTHRRSLAAGGAALAMAGLVAAARR